MDLIGGPLFRISAVVICALSFGAGLYNGASADVGSEFFAAFVLEVAMSAENLVAIYLVFRYFRVPPGVAQEHVLWWGFGISAVLRGAVIISGGLFIAAQKEAILLFACVVIYSGYRLAINSVPEDMVDETSEEGNKVIAAFQRVVPVSDYFDGVNFVTTNPVDGSSRLTPLFLVLLVIEATDLIFALDNVPALYSIVPSGNVLVVYAATLFGIATLRASYTLVAVSLPRMVHLQRTTGAVLVLVGVRSIADYFEKGHIFPPLQFLGLVVAILVAGMSASLYQAADTLGAGSDATAEGDAAGSMRRMERGADPMAAAMQGDAWAPGGDVHGGAPPHVHLIYGVHSRTRDFQSQALLSTR
jgi:tellurite resistance protein TerC